MTMSREAKIMGIAFFKNLPQEMRDEIGKNLTNKDLYRLKAVSRAFHGNFFRETGNSWSEFFIKNKWFLCDYLLTQAEYCQAKDNNILAYTYGLLGYSLTLPSLITSWSLSMFVYYCGVLKDMIDDKQFPETIMFSKLHYPRS